MWWLPTPRDRADCRFLCGATMCATIPRRSSPRRPTIRWLIWKIQELAALAKDDLEAARKRLCDLLSNYAGFKKCYLVVVFDGWKVKGNPGEKLQHHNIQVVYTKEGETGDAYIEALVARIGSNYAVRVATSDALVQLRSLRSGVLRMSARELREELDTANREMGKHFSI